MWQRWRERASRAVAPRPDEARAAPAGRFAYQVALAELAQGRLAHYTPDALIEKHGRLSAVFRLLGSDPGVTDGEIIKGRLASLGSFLITSQTSTMQRLSASYLQPLAGYLDFLQHHLEQRLTNAPHLAPRLAEVSEALCQARDRHQARLGADYWVISYQPTLSERLGALWPRGRLAAAPPGQQALEERCRLLGAALARAGILAERVRGAELAALCNSAWDGAFSPTLALSTAGTEVPAEALDAWVTQPEGDLTLSPRWATLHGAWVRSWYLCDFTGAIDETLISQLAALPGVRVLQFWDRMELAEARRVLRWNRLVTNAEQYLRPNGDVEDFDWQAKAQENDQHRARLAFWGEPIFRFRLLLQQWASSQEELRERAQALELVLKDRSQLAVHPATFQQREALEAGLPLGGCPFAPPERNLNAACLARLAYPAAADPLHREGVWLGMALPSRLQVTRDLFALQNPVVALIGPMGSGKSMTQKFLLAQLIAQGYPGFVLGGAREYSAAISLLGGTILPLGRADGPGLNPVHFDPADADEEGDPFVVGQTLFLDWVEAALRPLSEVERSVLGEAYDRALERAGILESLPATWDRPVPRLSDVHAALLLEPDDPELGPENPRVVARRLALALKPYALGRFAPLFNRHSALQLGEEHLICFDVYDVPERLRLAFVQPLLAFIQRHTLRKYRLAGSVIVLDEGHLLLHDERSARILEHLVRNGRKAKQLILFTQHTHSDSQRNASADLAHKTAGATLVFRINRQDLATCENLHLSPLEQQIVIEQSVGECLFVTPDTRLHLRVLIPPDWYPAFTTKPDEVLAQRLVTGPAAEPPPLDEEASAEDWWHADDGTGLPDWPQSEERSGNSDLKGGSAGILIPRRLAALSDQ